MPTDNFSSSPDSLIAPAADCFAVQPHDTNDLPRATKAIYVGTGGTVKLRSVRGAGDVTFTNVPDGAILDICVIAVRATGTTASNIVGLA